MARGGLSAYRRGDVRLYGTANLRGLVSARRRSSFPTLDPSTLTPLAPPPWATEAEAMALPPFGRGVALLANGLAGTQWHARRWDPDTGIWQRLETQPNVLTDPVPWSTVWHYKWSVAEDLILYGNHFARYLLDDARTNRPGLLAPLPADQLWLLIDPASGSWSYALNGDPIPAADVLHVSAGNRSGEVLGRGVLAQYAETLGGFVAAERHAGAYFYGGALPPAVLQAPHVVTQDQAETLKARWREMTSTREPVVLPSGYVLTPIVTNAESAQLTQSRNWNANLVAMMLGVPGWKLGLQGPSMTYQNVETADIDFVRDDLDRYASPLAHAFTKWLMPTGTEVAWDWAGRMRNDQRGLADVLTAYVGAGIFTQDEARAALNRPPLAVTTDPGTTPEGVPELTPLEAT